MIKYKQPKVLDCFWGQVVGGIASLAGGLLSNKQSKENTETAIDASQNATATQYRRNKKMYQNRYQWMTRDMRKAGLNPILAASGGFNPGSSPSVSASQIFNAQPPTSQYDFAGSAKGITESVLNEEQAKTEYDKRVKLKNEGLELLERAAKERSERGLISAQETQALKNVSLMTTQMDKLENEIELIRQGKKLTEEETKNLITLRNQMELNMSKLEQMSEVYKSPLGKLAAWVNALFGSINIGAAVTGSALMRR